MYKNTKVVNICIFNDYFLFSFCKIIYKYNLAGQAFIKQPASKNFL